MEIYGNIIVALPKQSGTSQNGNQWESQEFVLQTIEERPKQVVFEVFGADRLQRFGIQVGQYVTVQFSLDSREWNGRWFLRAQAWDVRQGDVRKVQPYVPQTAPVGNAPGTVAAPVPETAQQAVSPAMPFPPQEAEKLPFD